MKYSQGAATRTRKKWNEMKSEIEGAFCDVKWSEVVILYVSAGVRKSNTTQYSSTEVTEWEQNVLLDKQLPNKFRAFYPFQVVIYTIMVRDALGVAAV